MWGSFSLGLGLNYWGMCIARTLVKAPFWPFVCSQSQVHTVLSLWDVPCFCVCGLCGCTGCVSCLGGHTSAPLRLQSPDPAAPAFPGCLWCFLPGCGLWASLGVQVPSFSSPPERCSLKGTSSVMCSLQGHPGPLSVVSGIRTHKAETIRPFLLSSCCPHWDGELPRWWVSKRRGDGKRKWKGKKKTSWYFKNILQPHSAKFVRLGCQSIEPPHVEVQGCSRFVWLSVCFFLLCFCQGCALQDECCTHYCVRTLMQWKWFPLKISKAFLKRKLLIPWLHRQISFSLSGTLLQIHFIFRLWNLTTVRLNRDCFAGYTVCPFQLMAQWLFIYPFLFLNFLLNGFVYRLCCLFNFLLFIMGVFPNLSWR